MQRIKRIFLYQPKIIDHNVDNQNLATRMNACGSWRTKNRLTVAAISLWALVKIWLEYGRHNFSGRGIHVVLRLCCHVV